MVHFLNELLLREDLLSLLLDALLALMVGFPFTRHSQRYPGVLALFLVLAALAHHGHAVRLNLSLEIESLLHSQLIVAVVSHVALEAPLLVFVDFVVALDLFLLSLQVLNSVRYLLDAL